MTEIELLGYAVLYFYVFAGFFYFIDKCRTTIPSTTHHGPDLEEGAISSGEGGY